MKTDKLHLISLRRAAGALFLALWAQGTTLMAQSLPNSTLTETTPSRAEYFSWINNTLEGATAEQTAVNLDFFRWLRDTYGMQLDIYAFDAGAVDGAGVYGDRRSAHFKRQFPEGFGPLSRKAAAMGVKFGLWAGPDGFGSTEDEARERMRQMVELVKDDGFNLFKFDVVCGQLRPDKEAYFNEMMNQVRALSPDFLMLNYRILLNQAAPHANVSLLDGEETYIDVHMYNQTTATHHRVGAMTRQADSVLTHLREDHGVCLSSSLDHWDDDLVLQAFNRNQILAPQLYGNPWLLRDDEYPQLAFLFNLHRDYRDILVHGKRLSEEHYGPGAVSRGDGATQFLTLRNLTWNPVTYRVQLDEEVGLAKGKGRVKVRQYHPYVMDLGSHRYGEALEVEVAPFRCVLVKVTTATERDKVALSGIPYQIVNDRAGKEVKVKLLGLPGEEYAARVEKGTFRTANMDGHAANDWARGRRMNVHFDGQKLQEQPHRRLGVMEPCAVPADAQTLYYATAFAADNNALEARELRRSGPSEVPEVNAARRAFFEQRTFRERGLWDRYLFDDDANTTFAVAMQWGDPRVNGTSAFLLDMGEVMEVDSLVLEAPDAYSLLPLKIGESAGFFLSDNLSQWKLAQTYVDKRTVLHCEGLGAFRYAMLMMGPLQLSEVKAYKEGNVVTRTHWKANNLFRAYGLGGALASRAWKTAFTLHEKARGSYLCIAVNGKHGHEGAWAALKVGNRYVGCPDRAPAFKVNPWEFRSVDTDHDYTYYVPVTDDMVGQPIEAFVLGLGEGTEPLRPEVWITTYPEPFEGKMLTLVSK